MIIAIGHRGLSRAAATSKMERFVIIINGWKPLTIITKRSILNVAAALDPPLSYWLTNNWNHVFSQRLAVLQLLLLSLRCFMVAEILEWIIVPFLLFAFLAWNTSARLCMRKQPRFPKKGLFGLTTLTGENCILLNSVQEQLLGCFWPFSNFYTIN